MTTYVYTGDDERDFLYPTAFRVRPGDEIEADENPDPARFEAKSAQKKTSKKVEE